MRACAKNAWQIAEKAKNKKTLADMQNTFTVCV